MKKLLFATIALLLSANGAFADGDNKVMKDAKLTSEEAKAIALKEVPGTVVDCDFEKRKKSRYWAVDIKPADGKLKKEVRVDANSGAIISVKEDSE